MNERDTICAKNVFPQRDKFFFRMHDYLYLNRLLNFRRLIELSLRGIESKYRKFGILHFDVYNETKLND